MCDHHDTNEAGRHGAALEHGEAHERDHQRWSRRSFIRTLGLSGSGAFLLGNLPVSALSSSALAYGLSNTETDRVLVLIRLKGGNDSLNTIIPVFDYGAYQSLRPNIAIPQNQITALNDRFGMPNTMNPLLPLWEEGQMRVVNNVGYPNQNLSHFVSSDIWATADNTPGAGTSGWLGRYLMDLYPDYLTNPPAVPPAVQIGGVGNLAFYDSNDVNISVSVTDPDQLFEIAQNGELYDVVNLPDCLYGEQLGYMRTITNSTFIYAGVIKEAYDNAANAVDYGVGSLRNQLALVARLIKGGLGTKLYMVTLDGFDTHAGQGNSHPALMAELSGAVRALYDDLAADSFDDKVLSMTISEFGRRPDQNASAGTDHGAAAAMMLFGTGLNGSSLSGTDPDLQNLDPAGNLVFGTDFREVYATVLENWLCLDPDTVDSVMGQVFARLDLGINCEATSTFDGLAAPSIRHHVRYISSRQVVIHYTLPSAAPVRVEVFNILGQPVATLFEGYQMAGEHQLDFSPQNGMLVSGQYVYRIQAGEQAASQSIRILR